MGFGGFFDGKVGWEDALFFPSLVTDAAMQGGSNVVGKDALSKVPFFGDSYADEAKAALEARLQEQMAEAAKRYRSMQSQVPAQRVAAGRATANAFAPSAAMLDRMSGGNYKPKFDQMFLAPKKSNKSSKTVTVTDSSGNTKTVSDKRAALARSRGTR